MMDLGNDGGAAGAADAGGGAGGVADLLGGAPAAGGAGASGEGGEGAGAGAGAGADGGSGGGAAFDWAGVLPGDAGEGDKAGLLDWVKAANVPDVAALAKMARDNQTALRDSGRVKVPGEGASEAERSAFNKAIGVPDDSKGYAFEPPKDEDGQPLPMHTELIDRLQATALKSGTPAPVFKALIEDFVAYQMEEAGARDAELTAKAQAWVKAQGSTSTEKLAAIDRAAGTLGLTRPEMTALRQAWGPERALTIMARLGDGLAEDRMLSGPGGKERFGVTADQAQQQLDAMKGDPAVRAKVGVPGTPENLRWNRLNQAVADARSQAA